MEPRTYQLNNGSILVIREAVPEDAGALINYIESISGESDFLTFGPGEFELTEEPEVTVLRRFCEADSELYIVGTIDATIVAALSFSAGKRPRKRHCGEFGMTVRREQWGLGIGSLMLDTLIDWAYSFGIVKKLDLRVRTDNERAIALYQRKGFVIEGTIRKGIFLDGRYFDSYWMGLEL
jgi:RimJ/RimL family protein N-acetyltransferase